MSSDRAEADALTKSLLAMLFVFGCLPLAAGWADTLLTLDDGETRPWRNTQLVADPVHGGKTAILWDVAAHPSLDSPRFLQDWTAFDELRFWAHLELPVAFNVPIIFASEGGYYITDWNLDWSGWKEHRIRLAACRSAHKPQGWHRILHFGFRSQGYGQGAIPPGLALVFDDFALHAPNDLPITSLQQWMAKERLERMRELKSRGNPYYASVLDSLKDVKAEPSLPTVLKSSWTFSGLASKAVAAAWASASDESPRKGDATLIAHAAAIIDFCLSHQKDGSWFYSRQWESSDPNSDRFALGPLMDAIHWLRRLPQGAELWKRWDAPLRELVEFQYTRWGRYKESGFTKNEAWGSSAGRYPNQDVFHLAEMTFAHQFWGDDKYRQSAEETLAGLKAHLLPDGGFNYIGPETECDVYHALNVLWIARYYTLTKDHRARDLLARTIAYYPLSYSNEARPEYYTDCWWKHYWSDGVTAGPEIIAGVTGDPHNKWLADRLLERAGPGADYYAIVTGMFYRADIRPQPLPDHWLKLDRNIGGPRGRFGNWYFAGVPGGGARDTFVGAMVSEPDRPQPLNGAFLAANVEVGPSAQGPRLYISGPDDITSVAVEGDAAALGARYSVRKPYINSVEHPDVPPTPWQATQVWLLTRHGLVGLVELEATQEQNVAYLGGELRFGPDLPLTRDDAGVFRCGAVTMRLLEHNFGNLAFGPARPGYAQKTTTHSAVTLRTAGESHVATPGHPVRYAAAIAPTGATEFRDFQRLPSRDVYGFSGQMGNKRFVAAFNPAEQEAVVELAKRRLALPPRRLTLIKVGD